ncbi:MAG TPA: TonB-dependent receptor [Steroidobacteraceae bacterium]|jgi:iron complex outermembrane receptor protein|nr:TonB-dependent receptor [Steroidobacteraceae bacterium]
MSSKPSPRCANARVSLAVLSGLLIIGLLPSAAHAEAATDTDDNAQLPEVIVTAQKRAQDTKDVPVSVGVLDADALADLHVNSVEDVTRLMPGISFAHASVGAANGPGQDVLSIRGVSSTVGNPTVGTYVDEVPVITITGYEGSPEPMLVDIDRIEVLRGPQGTLYGASSEGGTIRFITVQPDSHTLGGWFDQQLSGTDHGGFNSDSTGAINLPVVEDQFALRVSAKFGSESGYINRYALEGSLADGTAGPGALLQSGVNSDQKLAVNVKGLWTVTDGFTVTPAVLFQRYDLSDTNAFVPALGYYNEFNQVRASDSDGLVIPSLTVQKTLGFADLISVTSYVRRNINRWGDGTELNTTPISQFVLDPLGQAGQEPYASHLTQNDDILGNIPSVVLFDDHFNTWSQELRLSSPADAGRIKWVTGVFVTDQEWGHYDYETAPGYSAAFQNIYGYSIENDPVLNPTVGSASYNPNFWANDLVWVIHDHNDVKQYAVFGQIDLDVTSNLHVGLGERYVKATERFTEIGAGFYDFGNAGVAANGGYGTPYSQSANFTGNTPKATVTLDVSPDTSLYASAGKGFRLGGATTPNYNLLCEQGAKQLGYADGILPSSYQPDQLWSYELGAKTLTWNKTLSINADVYYIRWSNLQQNVIIPVCGGSFNSNVGDALAIGSELEVRYRPSFLSGLELSVNLGGEHAYITSAAASAPAQSGQDVLYTPEYTATAVANYGFHISDTLTGFVRGDFEETGKSYGSFLVSTPAAPNPTYLNPAYHVVNLALGVSFSRYELSLFAKNLLNNQTILQSPVVNTVTMGYTLRPLTAGIELRAKF